MRKREERRGRKAGWGDDGRREGDSRDGLLLVSAARGCGVVRRRMLAGSGDGGRKCLASALELVLLVLPDGRLLR